jgi:hypothetical protein
VFSCTEEVGYGVYSGARATLNGVSVRVRMMKDRYGELERGE